MPLVTQKTGSVETNVTMKRRSVNLDNLRRASLQRRRELEQWLQIGGVEPTAAGGAMAAGDPMFEIFGQASSTTTSSSSSSSSSSTPIPVPVPGGLSAGLIAGIVILVLVAVALLAALGYWGYANSAAIGSRTSAFASRTGDALRFSRTPGT